MAEEKNNEARPGPGGPGGPRSLLGVQEKAQAAGVSFKRLIRYFFREKGYVLAVIPTVILATLAMVTAPDLQSHAIDIIAGKEEGVLLNAVLLMLAAYLLGSFLKFLQGVLCAKLGQRIVFNLRTELFDKFLKLPLKYADTHPHGDLMSRMTNDVENISGTVSQAVPTLISAVLTIIGTAAFMLILCWQLALLAFVTIFITFAASRVIALKVRKYAVVRQSELGGLNAHVQTMIGGFRTVRAFSLGKDVTQEFCEKSDRMTKAGIRAEVYAGIMGPVMNCIGNLEFVIIVGFGGYFALHDLLTVGVISAFIVYARQFSRPINEISLLYGQIQTALAGAERVFAVLDEPEEPTDGEDMQFTDAAAVEFDHVCFAYEKGSPVIEDLSLKVKAGAKVALVGATGSGKTTLASLLLRFYDLTGGRILINGRDLTTISRRSIRTNAALVPQDTFLFSDTIRANIAYGRENLSEEAVRLAARESLADAFIERLPEGYGTVLENSGSALSSGERQLLTIARAFAAAPKILILDEATSNVDTRTELQIQKALKQIMRGRTCFVIAHRLSTVRDADLIVVLDHGRVVQQGTHDSLIKEDGIYANLYRDQFAGFAT